MKLPNVSGCLLPDAGGNGTEKDRPASYLLEMIETVTDVKFDVSGKKIRISHK